MSPVDFVTLQDTDQDLFLTSQLYTPLTHTEHTRSRPSNLDMEDSAVTIQTGFCKHTQPQVYGQGKELNVSGCGNISSL